MSVWLGGHSRARFISSVAPSFIALEVEDSRGAVAPNRNSVEALVLVFEGVHEGVRRMARAFDDPHEPRLLWPRDWSVPPP
jgi:hypothetical protein